MSPVEETEVHVAELHLALACAAREPKAIALFEERYFAKLVTTLQRRGIRDDVTADVLGALRERLFFHDPPMIADYAGRGTLDAWLRRIALRAAVKRERDERRSTAPDVLEELPALAHDPEVAYLARSFGVEVKQAIAESLAALGSAERALLRRRLLDGSSIDTLAGRGRIHRATVARRIAKLRDQVVADVHRRLGTRLGLSKDEIRAMAASVGDELELSLPRLLGARNTSK